jgi:hypothetical protein
MLSRMPLAVFLLLTLSLGLMGACSTGFETRDSRRGDDDSAADDDDDTVPSDDDDTVPSDDDDTVPSDDDDTAPSDDDDTAPDYEGDDPGECSDGADNDQDGLFDCDDPNCSGSPDCAGDDDDASPPAGAPEITNVTYVWHPNLTPSPPLDYPYFEFSIDILDHPSCDLTPVILWWSYSGQSPAPLAAVGDPNPNCGTTYLFQLQLQNPAPGLSYSVVLSVEDASGNRSANYTVVAEIPS